MRAIYTIIDGNDRSRKLNANVTTTPLNMNTNALRAERSKTAPTVKTTTTTMTMTNLTTTETTNVSTSMSSYQAVSQMPQTPVSIGSSLFQSSQTTYDLNNNNTTAASSMNNKQTSQNVDTSPLFSPSTIFLKQKLYQPHVSLSERFNYTSFFNHTDQNGHLNVPIDNQNSSHQKNSTPYLHPNYRPIRTIKINDGDSFFFHIFL